MRGGDMYHVYTRQPHQWAEWAWQFTSVWEALRYAQELRGRGYEWAWVEDGKGNIVGS